MFFRKVAMSVAILTFLIVGSFSFAGSDETASDGVYVACPDGIVKDTATGLEWLVGPDKDMTWEEGKLWVERLNSDKAAWRMPKMKELEGLYKKDQGERNMPPLLKTTGWWVWSEDFKESSPHSMAWNFSFFFGNGRWNFAGDAADRRAFAVRSSSE